MPAFFLKRLKHATRAGFAKEMLNKAHTISGATVAW